MMPDSIAGGCARPPAVRAPAAELTCSGDARNQTGWKSYGRPGRYRRVRRRESLPAKDSAAITAATATGMITKISTVLRIDNLNAPRRLISQ